MSVRAQPGPQEAFLRSRADIVIYGGSAGGGKSFALLLDPTRGIHVPGFTAVIFRRTTPEIRNPGALWDESESLYSLVPGAKASSSVLEWTFPSGAVVKFAHLEHEKTKGNYQGSQLTFIGFDELTHFTESQFWYLLSRNRSTCGVTPYVRATCNPDPDSFVAKLIEWWIDQDTGLPIPERSGVLRWFIRIRGELEWYDTYEDVLDTYGVAGDDGETVLPEEYLPKSFTFIPSSIHDNPALIKKDPGYLANLNALPLVDRERLRHGNWKIRATAGNIFRRAWFPVVSAAPKKAIKRVRFWDFAATEQSTENPDPDYTAGVRMMKAQETGYWYIEHVERFRGTPLRVQQTTRNIATQDGHGVSIGFEQEPGASGKADAGAVIRNLGGFHVKAFPKRTNSLIFWRAFAAQAEAGNVYLVEGPWNEAFLSELENIDESLKQHDDQAVAAAGAFNMLDSKGPDYSILGRK